MRAARRTIATEFHQRVGAAVCDEPRQHLVDTPLLTYAAEVERHAWTRQTNDAIALRDG